MKRTPWTRLLVVAVVAAGLTAVLIMVVESRGGTLTPVPPLAWGVMVVIAAIVGVLGWNVRQYTRGKRPGMDMLLAARTVVLATAAAYTGALLTGWYAAQVLVTLSDLEIASRREVAVSAGVAVVVAVLLAVVGLVVERWCEVPPPDDDEGGPSAASQSPA